MSKEKESGRIAHATSTTGEVIRCGWDAVPTQSVSGPSLGKAMHTIHSTTERTAPESPAHYTVGDKQAWDTMRDLVPADAYEGYLTLNVVKYLVRHRKKNGKEDLLKARKYIDKLMEVCYGNKEPSVYQPTSHAVTVGGQRVFFTTVDVREFGTEGARYADSAPASDDWQAKPRAGSQGKRKAASKTKGRASKAE